jgi:hypothetical protein
MFRSRCFASAPTKVAFCLVLCAVLAAVSGCSKNGPYSCTKVSGKVMYEDGSLIKADEIQVVFLSQTPPIDSRTPPKPGRANADGKTGKFDFVTTFVHGDGIIAGEHKVIFKCVSGKRLQRLVPDDYTNPDKTPVKVKSSDPQPFEFKIPKPRQTARTANG